MALFILTVNGGVLTIRTEAPKEVAYTPRAEKQSE
jgi:hypothetical protein